MSKEEAVRLRDYVQANPYIIDYCDACDDLTEQPARRLPAYLLLATNPRLVPCHWDASQFSVQVDFETLVWGYNSDHKIDSPMPPARLGDGQGPSPVYRDDPRYCLTANYHWTLEAGVVERLGDVIGYSDTMGYGFFEGYPPPKVVRDSKQRRSYRKWYRERRRRSVD